MCEVAGEMEGSRASTNQQLAAMAAHNWYTGAATMHMRVLDKIAAGKGNPLVQQLPKCLDEHSDAQCDL